MASHRPIVASNISSITEILSNKNSLLFEPDNAKDLADATSYHRERQGKREFKGKSPLATSKGSTLVTREGLLNQLKQKFGKDTTDKSILSEENILNDE